MQLNQKYSPNLPDSMRFCLTTKNIKTGQYDKSNQTDRQSCIEFVELQNSCKVAKTINPQNSSTICKVDLIYLIAVNYKIIHL